MKRVFILLLVLVHLNSFSQTIADPAYANMQRAVGGILSNATASAGYSATSPQTYSTLYGVGKTALAGVATAGAGLLVAGTAPAWGTVLGVAAISGAVSYGVGLGIDSAVKWAFGPGSTPVTSTTSSAGPDPSVQGAIPITTTSLSMNDLVGNSINKPYMVITYGAPTYFTKTWYSTTAYVNPGPGTYMLSQTYTYSGTMYYLWETATKNSTTACPLNYSLSGSQCVSTSVVLSNVVLANQTLQQAVSALTDAQKAQQVNADTMALMINLLWQKAAADPSYAGAPYVATKPITAADVTAWMDANPTIKPKVNDFVTPVTNTSTGFAPSLPTPVNQPVSPVVTPTAPTAPVAAPVTVTNPVTVDLGTDPHTVAPTLDAPDWLQPLLNMLPGWRNASFTAQGVCYQPTFDLRPVIPKVVVMTSHCDLLEAQRNTLSVVMSVVWGMVAAFIILRA